MPYLIYWDGWLGERRRERRREPLSVGLTRLRGHLLLLAAEALTERVDLLNRLRCRRDCEPGQHRPTVVLRRKPLRRLPEHRRLLLLLLLLLLLCSATAAQRRASERLCIRHNSELLVRGESLSVGESYGLEVLS